MLRKRCRSAIEAEMILDELNKARKIIDKGVAIEGGRLSYFDWLGTMEIEFAAFLRSLTGVDSEQEINAAIILPGFPGSLPEDVTGGMPEYSCRLNPVYRDAIRIKIREWEEEIQMQRDSMRRLERDRPQWLSRTPVSPVGAI